MNRWEYLIRRLGSGMFVILGVLLVTFIISRVLPGDPASLYLGHRVSAEKVEEVREELGLNDPMYVQFVRYVSSTLRGEFGYSFFTKRLIIDDLKVRFPATSMPIRGWGGWGCRPARSTSWSRSRAVSTASIS